VEVFLTFFVILVALSFLYKFDRKDLGLSSFKDGALAYVVVLGVSLVGLFVLSGALGKVFDTQTGLVFLFFTWSLPISFVQEYMYRAYVKARLKPVTDSAGAYILVSSFLFMILHSMYTPLLVVFPLTFFAGVLFALIYSKYPNLLLITFVHAVLNTVAIAYGYF
jgi:membrane protease YdiL (CAAX protease family)